MDKKTKILVIDDEPDMLGVLVQRLQANGYAVSVASNGQEALSSIKDTLPDLIILDVLMPVMDGFTFYKELKKNKLAADIPVLVLTARNKMEDTFSAVGVDAFVAKPFDAQILLEKVNALLIKAQEKRLRGEGLPGVQSTGGVQKPHMGIVMIGVFLLIVVVAVIFLVRALASSSQEGTIKIKRHSHQAVEEVEL